jgi:drug/metabolite transporter (DMT)-like permease
MVLGSALLHAIWSASIKGSGDPFAFNLRQKAFFLTGFAVVAPFTPWAEIPVEAWALVAGTAVAHALYLYWLSASLATTDFTVAYPIIRSTPALLPFIAVPLLGEQLSPAGAFGITVVVAGVWLVHTRGELTWSALVAPGMGFAYWTLLATVAYSLFDKRAMEVISTAPWDSPFPRSVFYFFLTTAANALLFIPLALRKLPRGNRREAFRGEWRTAGVAALVSLASYGLVLEAYRTAPASYVVAVRQASVLFAVAIGTVFLHERPGRARVLGAAATVVGVALIALFP